MGVGAYAAKNDEDDLLLDPFTDDTSGDSLNNTDLCCIVKADVQGTAEAVRDAVLTLGSDAVGVKVRGEVRGALDGWDAKGRWASIFGAGLRDDADGTIFDKIVAGDIPSDKVYEDDLCYAFRDINPVAPTHVLLIPKVRSGLTQLRYASPDQAALLGHLMSKVGAVAEAAGLGDAGYRLVVNDGADACQTVFHLHLHIIGGRELAWPPG